MNTLFVFMVWAFFYCLFLHPLNESEYIDFVMDRIYREFAEGYDES